MRIGLISLVLAAVILALGTPLGSRESGTPAPTVLTVDIEGPIGPATADHIGRALDHAAREGAVAVVLRQDTPGGLDTAMRTIVQDILSSPVPVISWVGPSGARAASAGTFISYAAHVAAMAPGTNLGAATPVAIGAPGLPGGDAPDGDKPQKRDRADRSDGDSNTASDDDRAGDDTAEPSTAKPDLPEKAMNDAAAYIRSLAQLRGRNADWGEAAVTKAASLSAEEAMANNVIDLIAKDVPDLLSAADGRVVTIAGVERTLNTADATVVNQEIDWRTAFLAFITNPNVAYILMLIGIYGIVFEFYSPGLIGPGVIGAICLILGLYAFQLLPVNAGGLALTLLGLALIVAEALTPGIGVLGIGGIAAFAIGSVMLLDTDVPGYTIAWELVGSVAAVAGAFLLLVLSMAVRGRKKPVVSGAEEMIGSPGRVLSWRDDAGQVHAHGEIWRARSGSVLNAGDAVRIVALNGLTLIVEAAPADHPEATEAKP